MRVLVSLLAPLVAASLLACSGTESSSNKEDAPQVAPVVAPRAEQGETGGTASGAQLESLWAEQKLLRSANLEVEVASIKEATGRIEEIAKTNNGLLADTQVAQDEEGKRTATVAVRVPSERFDEVLRQLRQLGEVKRESTTTQDITKAYADLEIRLAVKRETEERLRQLLASRTGNLSEVLQVERELSRVRSEIEQMEGERRYFDQRIAVSTITVQLREKDAGLWPGSMAPIGEALDRSLEVFSTSIAIAIYVAAVLLPWLVLASLAAWIVWFLVRRVRARARR